MFPLPYLYLILIASCIWAGCGTQEENANTGTVSVREGKTELGAYTYVHHLQNAGPKPLPNQIVTYNYRIRQGGRVIVDNFDGAPASAVLPLHSDAREDPKPIMEGLRLMSVGDSLTIIVSAKEGPDKEEYIYDVVLRNIINRQ